MVYSKTPKSRGFPEHRSPRLSHSQKRFLTTFPNRNARRRRAWSARKPPKPLDFQIVAIAVSDVGTLALTAKGRVYHWGESWCAGPDQPTPKLIEELFNVTKVTCSPSGYYHGRTRRLGFSCLALTREGHMYTWGANALFQLSATQNERPSLPGALFRPSSEFQTRPTRYDCAFVQDACCGIGYLTFATVDKVFTSGSFCAEAPRFQKEWLELRDLDLKQLEAGSFHCCALTTKGDCYTFGDARGADDSNGNLLGHGPDEADFGLEIKAPCRIPNIPPILECVRLSLAIR